MNMKYGKSSSKESSSSYSYSLPRDVGSGYDGMTQGVNYEGCKDADQMRSMVNYGKSGGYAKGSRYPK